MDTSEKAVIAWCVPVIDAGMCAVQLFLSSEVFGLQILLYIQLTLTPNAQSLCFQIPVTIMKPDEKAEIPVGVVIGSILAGLLLLLVLVAVLWKVSRCLYS